MSPSTRGKRRLGRGGVALVLLCGALGFAAPAAAQTADELKAARELFQEAFKDERDKRYADALEKFQRVAKVKESASVRYRIATNLAALGRLREARDMFRALAAAKATLPASDQETADSAAEKALELDRRIPRLSLRLQESPPPEVRVTVDGAPVPVSTTPRSLELDPGDHVIAATGRGATPSEETVTLTEGAPEVSRTVTLTSDRTTAATPPGKIDGAGNRPNAKGSDRTLAWVAASGGGALVVTAAALLLAREGAISDIQETCPGRICPETKRRDVEDARDRAELFGPLGVALGVVGVAAVGFGVWMLLRSPTTPPPQTAGLALLPVHRGGHALAWTF